jgi:hypothetical protein
MEMFRNLYIVEFVMEKLFLKSFKNKELLGRQDI